jgi:hypothetical protein
MGIFNLNKSISGYLLKHQEMSIWARGAMNYLANKNVLFFHYVKYDFIFGK